jgi:hypothetical protein
VQSTSTVIFIGRDRLLVSRRLLAKRTVTRSGTLLIFRRRLVGAGGEEKGVRTAHLTAPATRMTWRGAARIKALSRPFAAIIAGLRPVSQS